MTGGRPVNVTIGMPDSRTAHFPPPEEAGERFGKGSCLTLLLDRDTEKTGLRHCASKVLVPSDTNYNQVHDSDLELAAAWGAFALEPSL
jgi:hypothetical protein